MPDENPTPSVPVSLDTIANASAPADAPQQGEGQDIPQTLSAPTEPPREEGGIPAAPSAAAPAPSEKAPTAPKPENTTEMAPALPEPVPQPEPGLVSEPLPAAEIPPLQREVAAVSGAVAPEPIEAGAAKAAETNLPSDINAGKPAEAAAIAPPPALPVAPLPAGPESSGAGRGESLAQDRKIENVRASTPRENASRPEMSQPSPPPAIGVRTMRSDELSLKASGGLGVAPQVFAPADFESEPIFKPDEGEKPRPGAPEQRLLNTKAILVSLGMLATIAAAAIAAYAFLGRGGA